MASVAGVQHVKGRMTWCGVVTELAYFPLISCGSCLVLMCPVPRGERQACASCHGAPGLQANGALLRAGWSLLPGCPVPSAVWPLGNLPTTVGLHSPAAHKHSPHTDSQEPVDLASSWRRYCLLPGSPLASQPQWSGSSKSFIAVRTAPFPWGPPSSGSSVAAQRQVFQGTKQNTTNRVPQWSRHHTEHLTQDPTLPQNTTVWWGLSSVPILEMTDLSQRGQATSPVVTLSSGRGWHLNLSGPKAPIPKQYPPFSLFSLSLPLNFWKAFTLWLFYNWGFALRVNPALCPHAFLWWQLTFLFLHAPLCLAGPLCPCHLVA